MYKKSTTIGMTVALLLGAGAGGCKAISAQAATQSAAVFFVPHQDDETLTMAANIEQETRSGRPVHVVLVTDGGASGARALIAKRGYSLTRAQFVDARNKEFVAALGRLGVPASHIHFENIPDGTLTVMQAKQVIEKWYAKFPNASLKTMSAHDLHPDHRNLGAAMMAVNAPDKRYLQFRRYWSLLYVPGWYAKGTSRTAAAASEYQVWNPCQGRYSVGWISVAKDFKALKTDPRSKVSTVG